MFCRTFVYTVRIANKSIPYNYYYVLGSRVAEDEEVCSVDLLHCYNRLSMEEFPASKYRQCTAGVKLAVPTLLEHF